MISSSLVIDLKIQPDWHINGHEPLSENLIPTTLELTNMSDLRAGDRVNIETDILARTLHHQMQLWFDGSNPGEVLAKLKERGFA